MSEQTTATATEGAAAKGEQEAEALVPLTVPLPEVHTKLRPEEIVRKLDAAARRGKMPGFAAGGGGGALFEVGAFGTPYEGVMRGYAAAGDGGTEIRFEARLKPLMPWVVGVVLALSVWPGVWLTESMLASMAPSWTWLWGTTWWWYLPLTAPFVPWVMWKTLRQSRALVHDSAHKAVEAVKSAVAG